MMFGTRDKFTYLECTSCGCLELLNPPADLSRYYPRNYYSMAKGKVDLWLRHLLCPSITRYWLGRVSPIGYLLGRNRRRLPVLDWLERHGIRGGSSLLDVGSGVGGLLFFLRGLGFNRLVGVDPFIASDLHFPAGSRFSSANLARSKAASTMWCSTTRLSTWRPRSRFSNMCARSLRQAAG